MTLRAAPFARILLSSLLCAAAPVGAGTIVDAATAIETRIAAADMDGAMAAARALFADVWAASPKLGFSQSLLVAEAATGYGVYNPRSDNLFKKDDPILLYCEPFGFAYGAPGEGLFSIGFIVDLQVLDASGAELANVPDVTELDLTSRFQNKEFQANITYNLGGIQPGRYTLVTTLRDKNSTKSGAFQTSIEIVE